MKNKLNAPRAPRAAGVSGAFCFAALALTALWPDTASAAPFRWANDGDANSLDPYARQETFLLSFDQNFYDPLVRRDRALALEPALATSWELAGPNTWRFHLREGVKFHGGEDFTADDVVFSFKRATSPGSQINSFLAGVTDVVARDKFTVDFISEKPNPILPDSITLWGIMSRHWCEAHDAARTMDLTKSAENYATRHEDGTGPYILDEREPDRRTTMHASPNWWDKQGVGVKTVEFLVIGNAATRVAALLSGDIDMIYSVPPQDVERLRRTDGITVFSGPELRTIFFGFDQSRDKLLSNDTLPGNPFRNRDVRRAFNMAVDADAIRDHVMDGLSHPTGLLYGPGVNGYRAEDDKRYPHDVEGAKALLTQAGYPNGFKVRLDCPNDRYVKDAAICQAVISELAKIGITIEPNIVTKMTYFATISNPGYQTDFYMLGWTPSTFDAQNSLFNLAGTRNGVRGVFNDGGYSNPALDALIDAMGTETDHAKRQALISRAAAILREDAAFLPLHQQSVVWAARQGIELQQEADDSFPLRFVRVAP